MNELAIMLGKTIISINKTDDHLVFTDENHNTYEFYHQQDCCESVYIDDVCGDLDDLIGSPLLQAQEVSSDNEPNKHGAESFTWTFYKFATNKGSVTVKWFGSSNGYYSEGVSFTHDNNS